MHPLFRLISTRPQLLADHAEAYAALVAAEVPRVSAAWKRRALLLALALVCLAVAAGLAGVAWMLWAVLPESQIRAPWVLLVVPAVPVLTAIACLLAARSTGEAGAFSELREQVKADIGMLREVAPA